MRKLFLVLSGAKWTELVMLMLSLTIAVALSFFVFDIPEATLTHILALFHSYSLVYWVYRASVLRQGK